MNDSELINAVAYAVRAAGSLKQGGGSRRWVAEFFLPALRDKGLTIVRLTPVPADSATSAEYVDDVALIMPSISERRVTLTPSGEHHR